MRELRDDQTAAVDQLRDHIAMGHKRICMQAPTGFGKTVLAAAVINGAIEKKKRVLFTVPAIPLVDQTVEMFFSQGISDIGVMQGHHMMGDSSKPVQIASVQTLIKREMPACDLVVVDECHRWFKVYERWLSTTGWQCPVIGLSATPWTKGLGSWYRGPFKLPADEQKQCLIVASTTQELIDKKLLSDFKVFAPTHPDLSNVRIKMGDFDETQLSEKMRNGVLVADAVDTWLRLAEWRPTLCYAVDRAHADALKQKFNAAGVPAEYQDHYTTDHDRIRIKSKFHRGEVKVVCNVGTLTTGIDWDVRCISMCRPTKSDMLFAQIVGRGLRTAEGKDHCLILDHSDNHQRLGFVTDIDVSYSGLHEGKSPPDSHRVDNIRLPKECPKCAFLRSPSLSTCPACGFKAEVISKVQHDKGELRELCRKTNRRNEVFEVGNPEVFFAELQAFAQARRYNPGWAMHKYREKMGSWPPDEFKNLPPALGVSRPTERWIRSRQIAWARSKLNNGDQHVGQHRQGA